MSVTYLIVDDRDPSISYGPTGANWTKNNGADIEFMLTTNEANTLGSSMTFSFSGKSMFAFGTLGGSTDPQTVNAAFVIDDDDASSNIITSRRVASHHISIFNATSLEDTTHSASLEISGEFFSNFFLDYIIVEATENSTISHPTTSRIFIDDTSPYLSWSGDWAVATPPWVSYNDSFTQTDGTYNGSVTGAVAVGASVTLNFIGTTVDVYGMAIASSDPPASYTIDGSIPINVSMPVDIGDPSPAFNWHYISVPLSSGGNHTLVITSEIANSFYIDYVLVGSNTAFVPPPTAADKDVPSTSAPEPTTATSMSPPSNATKQRNKSGVIAGSVVGAVSLVVLLVLGVFLWRRRRRSRSQQFNGAFLQDAESPPHVMITSVTPFPLIDSTPTPVRALLNTQQGNGLRLEFNGETGNSRMIQIQPPSNISKVARGSEGSEESQIDRRTTLPPAYTA